MENNSTEGELYFHSQLLNLCFHLHLQISYEEWHTVTVTTYTLQYVSSAAFADSNLNFTLNSSP